MAFHNLMNQTVDVKRRTRTRDDYGTWTQTETNRYAGMPCRIQPISGKERLLYDSKRSPTSHKLFCEATYSGITAQDVVIDSSNRRYEVVLVRNIDYMDHHMEVELRYLTPAT